MARGGEERGLRLVGLVGNLLRLLERQLDRAPRLELPLQAEVQQLVLLRALADGFLERRGGLEPAERAALVVDRALDTVHQRLDGLAQCPVVGAQAREGRSRGCRGTGLALGTGRRRRGLALHRNGAMPRQVKELFAWIVLNCSPSEANPTTELRPSNPEIPAVRPLRSM